MNIPINKDIEEEYKDQVVNGFTIKEVALAVVAVVIVVGTALIAYFKFGISPLFGSYIGLPIAFPIIFLGFKKFQGLTATEYIKEILYEHRTKILTYDAQEVVEETQPFTLRKGERNHAGKK